MAKSENSNNSRAERVGQKNKKDEIESNSLDDSQLENNNTLDPDREATDLENGSIDDFDQSKSLAPPESSIDSGADNDSSNKRDTADSPEMTEIQDDQLDEVEEFFNVWHQTDGGDKELPQARGTVSTSQ